MLCLPLRSDKMLRLGSVGIATLVPKRQTEPIVCRLPHTTIVDL